MKRIYLSLVAVLLTFSLMAQTSRVQVIHNSPSPGTDSGPTVDIYVNGGLLEELTAVPYRAATSFLDVPAGVDINIAVAVSPSNDVGDAIASFNLGQLTDGGTYVVIAHGIVGDATTPFNLAVNASAKETADIAGNVEFSVFHGSTDAPAVDVEARSVAQLVTNLTYPSFTGTYVSVAPDTYTLDIRTNGQTDIVASFTADLSGLANGAATVFASGLLNGTPAFGLLAALPDGTVMEFPLAVEPPALVINELDYDQPNSDGAEFIEIKNVGEEPVSLNGVEVILTNGSTGADYSITKLANVELKAGEYYVVCYGNNTAEYCDQTVSAGLQNGAPDAIRLVFDGEVLDAVSYEGDVAGIVEGTGIATGDNNNEEDIGLSRSPDGVDTDDNNNDFILACISPGATNNSSKSCIATTDSAMVQVIHNSPSPMVDIYANGDILVEDFEFRGATPFVSVPAGVDIEIAVAGAGSSSAADAIATFMVNFTANETYIVVATGIIGDAETPFELAVFDMGRKQGSSATDVDLLVYHGATDAPAVDVRTSGAVIVDNIPYKAFRGYFTVPATEYFFDITPGDDNTTLVGTYRAEVSNAGGSALTVFASGLLAGDPEFGLWVADASGNTAGLERVYLDSANVQIIHNSPTTSVDIYANEVLVLPDFQYGMATPYLRLAAGLEYEIAVAAAPSTSSADAIATFNVTFEANKSYAVVANGIPGNVDDPFKLEINDQARTSAVFGDEIDILAFHGSANSPSIDVGAKDGPTLITNLSYTEFSDYVSVSSGAYTLEVKPTGTEDIVASFEADLASLAGQSVTVVARGDLEGQEIPFGLLAVLADGTTLPLPETPSANVQVIHNAIGADTVDIYAGDELLLDNFAFRTATPFVKLPAGVDITLGVAPSNSTSSADAIATFDVNLTNGSEYLVVANGILGDATNPFGLAITDMARSSATDASQVDLITFHGSPGAPAVDIDVRGLGNMISNLSFGNFTDYLSVAPDLYYLDIRPAGIPTILNTYAADLNGLAGQSVTLVASGLLIGEPGFSALAVLADGTVIPLEASQVANVQVIHNAIGADTVDIYAGDELLLDNFAFRTATPFTFLPAGVDIRLGVAPGNSTSIADTLTSFTVQFDNGKEYLVVANGILGDATNPFGLAVNDMGRSTASDASQVDLITFHGSPGAPAVDVDVRGLGNVISNLSIGNFTDYLSVVPDLYYLDIRPAGIPTILNTYAADLNGLAGQSVTLVASGLLIGEPGFSALAVLADGTVIPLEASQVANVQVIHNAIGADTVDIYAGDELLLDNFAFRTATPFTFLPAGVDIRLGVAPGNSTSIADTLTSFTVQFDNGKEYLVVANGILGDATNPFGLAVNDMGRSTASDASQVDLITFHGSPGAPAVDVDVRGLGNVISNLSIGNFTDYLSVVPDLYYLDIRPAGIPTILNTYAADLNGLAGQSVTLVASGLLIGEPGFSALAVLADGTVIPLEASQVANVQVIHNAIGADTVDIYAGDELLLDDFAFRTATPFTFLPAGVEIRLGVAPGNSTSIADTLTSFTVQFDNGKEYLVIANGILGDATNPFGLAVNDMGRSTASDASQVDLITFHGSPGAPAVDVDVRGVGNVISNLSFGNFTDYLSVTPDLYYLDIRPAGVSSILNTYAADLSGLAGQSVTLVASGLLIGNPGFVPLAVLADGTVIPLEASQVANVQVIHNAIGADTVDIYAGDELLLDNFAFRTATPFTFLPAGIDISVGIAPANSTSVEDVLTSFDVNFMANSTYVVIAKGILGNATTPFGLAINDMGQTAAATGAGVDLLLYHGSPDAPEVDVLAGETVLYDNVAYDGFSSGYLNVPAAEYVLDITPSEDNSNIVVSYLANITSLEGGAAIVFASGRFGGEDPAFGIWVALPDGMTFPLPLSTNTNELERIVETFTMAPNPAYDQTTLTFGLTESTDLNVEVYGLNGQLFQTLDLGTLPKGQYTQNVELNELPAGQYAVSLISNKGILTKKLIVLE